VPTTIQCPCCNNALYETAHIDGPFFAKLSGPESEQDDKGSYMICPHPECLCRVDFVGLLSLSPVQKCGKFD
jgi:hypothetical protein